MWGSGFRVRSLEFRAWGNWGCDHYVAKFLPFCWCFLLCFCLWRLLLGRVSNEDSGLGGFTGLGFRVARFRV